MVGSVECLMEEVPNVYERIAPGIRWSMIERLYVSNFRCFENFTLDLKDLDSALIIGKNGSGKSTLRQALGVFQKICRGPNRGKSWIDGSDFAQGRTHIPMRFELDLKLAGQKVKYAISFELTDRLRKAEVAEELFSVDSTPVFSRKLSEVTTHDTTATFGIDSRFAALSLLNDATFGNALQQFKSFCSSMILVAPIPSQMSGFSENESFELDENAKNFADWLNTLLRRKPQSYRHILTYLQEIMPDLSSFENVPRGENGYQLIVTFQKEGNDASPLPIEFKKLSDGEKCFFLSALVLVSNRVNGPVFCFWDEPDNHLSLPEVNHFIMHLRRMTNNQGQFIATTHNPEAIRQFSDENTLVLTRKSHLEPTVVRLLSEYQYEGDLIDAILLGEIIE